jgi:hypothetical protein
LRDGARGGQMQVCARAACSWWILIQGRPRS